MDLAVTWDLDHGDLVLGSNGDLLSDAGLKGAVVASLMTDRLADLGDEIPDGTDDRRGSWHDSFLGVPGDLEGSQFWNLGRCKDVPETYLQVNEIGAAALQWLIDDGVAATVTVTSYRISFGLLGVLVVITKPKAQQPINIALQFAWEGL